MLCNAAFGRSFAFAAVTELMSACASLVGAASIIEWQIWRVCWEFREEWATEAEATAAYCNQRSRLSPPCVTVHLKKNNPTCFNSDSFSPVAEEYYEKAAFGAQSAACESPPSFTHAALWQVVVFFGRGGGGVTNMARQDAEAAKKNSKNKQKLWGENEMNHYELLVFVSPRSFRCVHGWEHHGPRGDRGGDG